MRRNGCGFILALLAGLLPGGGIRSAADEAEPSYTLAFAHFGPRNTDLFLADADGKNAKPLVPHAENDYNASYSADGEWVVFTSHRKGSADIWRVRPDGTGLERLTDDPAFDDHVGDAIEATIDSLLGAGAPMVLWVRCPYFSATVGADLLPPRLVASRDPARVDRLDELIDDAAARHPGQVCVVGFDDWVDRRVDDPAIRPDGSHYEWREPTGAGDAYLASLVAAHDACTDES